jgi:hypothetical protein
MDTDLLAGIERICTLPENQLKVERSKLLEGLGPPCTITIRSARDSFTKQLLERPVRLCCRARI